MDKKRERKRGGAIVEGEELCGIVAIDACPETGERKRNEPPVSADVCDGNKGPDGKVPKLGPGMVWLNKNHVVSASSCTELEDDTEDICRQRVDRERYGLETITDVIEDPTKCVRSIAQL